MSLRGIDVCARMKFSSKRLPHRVIVVTLAVVEHEPIEAFRGACECVVELLERCPKSVGNAFFAMTCHCASLAHVQNTVHCFGSSGLIGVMTDQFHGFPVIKEIGQVDQSSSLIYVSMSAKT